MTKQNVEVNVNMVNVEGVSGVNGVGGVNTMGAKDTTIRVLKPTHERAKLFKLVFGYSTMDELINDVFDMKLNQSDDTVRLKYKLLQSALYGGDDK